jgi:hypothetical protein
MPRSKKANTPARKRQWDDVEKSQLARGRSPKIAAMSANAAVRDHPAKAKK